jgi:hypothetical protein
MKKPSQEDGDPSSIVRASRRPSLHKGGVPEEGEFIITRDEIGAKTWHVAQVTDVLTDRTKVNYHTTLTQQVDNYSRTSPPKTQGRLDVGMWKRTWCLDNGMGKATTTPPTNPHRRTKDLWTGKLPLSELDRLMLARDVGVNSEGHLDTAAAALASKLKIPHHVGADGEENFVDEETFQCHVRMNDLIDQKRLENKKKKKTPLLSSMQTTSAILHVNLMTYAIEAC